MAKLVYFSLTLFLFILSTQSLSVSAIENYCSQNTLGSNDTSMQFTKETSFEEFAIVGKFKGLHCCAKGYRSIEWYKDGQIYPWPSVSQLIIYPESANQTVYTQTVTEDDAGNYTCVLRNDSIVHKHTIQLKVFEKLPDDPKITYISDDKRVAIGKELRLFCEAFGGRVDLPDAHNEAVWRKLGHNGSIFDDSRVQQKKNSREDGQTFGTYLIIKNVKMEDFGEYVCRISKPGKTIERQVNVYKQDQVEYINPNPVPVKKLLIFSAIIILVCATAAILYLRFGLMLRVGFKDKFGPLETCDGKITDVLIVYSINDSEIALGEILPTLESRYSYRCASRELPNNVNRWYSDLQVSGEKSRRIVALLSPDALCNKWDTNTVYHALKQLQSASHKLTIVSLKELPTKENEIKNSQGETLCSLSRVMHVITWDRSNDSKFWLNLRLRLPPQRRTLLTENIRPSPEGENCSRLTMDSRESLTNLV